MNMHRCALGLLLVTVAFSAYPQVADASLSSIWDSVTNWASNVWGDVSSFSTDLYT